MPKPPALPSPVQLEPHGDRFRLTRAGELYAVPSDGPVGAELRGLWCSSDAIPDGFTVDLTPREAGLLAPLLRQPAWGKLRSPTATEDGQLIERVCRVIGVSQAELAARTGIAPAVLSRARKPTSNGGRPLTDKDRETLRKLVQAAGSG